MQQEQADPPGDSGLWWETGETTKVTGAAEGPGPFQASGRLSSLSVSVASFSKESAVPRGMQKGKKFHKPENQALPTREKDEQGEEARAVSSPRCRWTEQQEQGDRSESGGAATARQRKEPQGGTVRSR